MKTKMQAGILVALVAVGAALLFGQQSGEIRGTIVQGEKPAIAVIDFRGSGDAQKYMTMFNQTLWDDLATSGILKMVGKSFYPLVVPQQPADFKAPSEVAATKREPAKQVSNGPWFTDWRNPPVSANYLAFGYTAVQDNKLTLAGNLFNVGMNDVVSANVFTGTKLYFGALSNDGARSMAHEYAADILKQFGAMSLTGTKVFFISDRTGNKEAWSMDYDGTNQRQITSYKAITNDPAVSADGKTLAVSTQTKLGWEIRLHSVETGRRLAYYSPGDSTAGTPEFTPDGSRLFFHKTVDGYSRLVVTDMQGSNLKVVSTARAIEVSPRVNPKNAKDLLFISGRSGRQQLWRMNEDGTDLQMLTSGEGDVANPAWSPNGQMVAFAWTRGYEPGNLNIFVMDINKKQPIQLTSASGRNENPTWAPDGLHIVYSSKRGRETHIYSMLADGSAVKQLTTAGNNTQPVWAKGLN